MYLQATHPCEAAQRSSSGAKCEHIPTAAHMDLPEAAVQLGHQRSLDEWDSVPCHHEVAPPWFLSLYMNVFERPGSCPSSCPTSYTLQNLACVGWAFAAGPYGRTQTGLMLLPVASACLPWHFVRALQNERVLTMVWRPNPLDRAGGRPARAAMRRSHSARLGRKLCAATPVFQSRRETIRTSGFFSNHIH